MNRLLATSLLSALAFAPAAAAECLGLPEACAGTDGGPAGDAYACDGETCTGVDLRPGTFTCDPVENPRCVLRIQYEPEDDTLCLASGPRGGTDYSYDCPA